jgi:hypothetical protein
VTTPDLPPDPPPLTKAVLYRLKDGQPAGKGKPPNVTPDGKPISVQFNPTSLKIQRQNNIDKGGYTDHTQHRQNPSPQPATLSFDLEFDTAEGDASGQPLDVRTLTAQIRQFVEPNPTKPADPPPRVLFLWGKLKFPGIITQLTEDLDYFASNGMALRAKLSVTITEQNLALEAMKEGPGARIATNSTPPGGSGSATDNPDSGPSPGPGSSGTNNPMQVTLAQSGESIQQLLTRLDQDPSTWRSAMNDLSSPLSLTAGAQVQLGAAVSVSAGIGVSAGFAAGASAGITAGAGAAGGAAAVLSAGTSAAAAASADATAAFSAGADVDVVATAGASATATAFAGASASASAGFALAAGGGVGVTYNRALGAQVDAAVGSARASFDVPAAGQGPSVTNAASPAATGAVSPVATAATSPNVASTAGAGPAGAAPASAGGTASAQPANLVVQVDARAVTFGRGIPLSARADVNTVASSQTGGQMVIGARVPTAEIPSPTSPVAPPWQQPPA